MQRKKAPTFQQVTDICLGELKLLIQRLSVGLDPTYSPDTAPGQQPDPSVKLVPQIAQPLKADKQIAALPPAPTSKWEHVEAVTAGLAKSHSTPANSQQAYGREAINKSMEKAHGGAQQASSLITTYYHKLASTHLGALFRHTLPRTAKLVVLGTPYSRLSLICNAATALANLAVFSLREDALGRFHQGVPDIIRVFTAALLKLDEYMASIPLPWSDDTSANTPEGERRKVPEIEAVRESLRLGLDAVLRSFTGYLGDMGLSALEISQARKVVRGGEEGMVQIGGR